LAEVIRLNACYLQTKEASPTENRTAFWHQIPKAAGTYNLTINGVIKVHADFARLRQNWWKAARPFSGSEGGKQTFVHSMGKVANRPFLW